MCAPSTTSRFIRRICRPPGTPSWRPCVCRSMCWPGSRRQADRQQIPRAGLWRFPVRRWVELRGFEPLTFSLRTRRATNCAIAPRSTSGRSARRLYHRFRCRLVQFWPGGTGSNLQRIPERSGATPSPPRAARRPRHLLARRPDPAGRRSPGPSAGLWWRRPWVRRDRWSAPYAGPAAWTRTSAW